MEIWDSLTTLAVLGTERQHDALHATGALGAVLERIYPPSVPVTTLPREQALLDATAVLALYQQSGQLPTQALHGPRPACAGETRPALGAQDAFTLSVLMTEPAKRALLPEYLALVAQRQQRVPFALLPALLDVGHQERSLRPMIVAILGERGVWLAQQHDAWSYARSGVDPLGTAEQLAHDWETGSHDVRLLVLQHLRQSAPEQARTFLAGTWRSERAPRRVELLATCRQGLSMADEPFLESCLDERSQEVRSTAAQLLASLPGSRLCQRMWERVTPLLTYTARSGLHVTLPAAFDPAWERDSIRPKVPAGHRRGEPSWWLQQMLGFVPPSWWTQRWEVSAEHLLSSLAQHSWAAMLCAAWSHATLCQPDSSWAAALLSLWPAKAPRALWELLPEAPRLATWRACMQQAADSTQRLAVLEYLSGFPGPWSRELTIQVAQALGTLLTEDTALSPYNVQEICTTCALRMAPGTSAALAQMWEPALQDGANCAKSLSQVLDTLRMRESYLLPARP